MRRSIPVGGGGTPVLAGGGGGNPCPGLGTPSPAGPGTTLWTGLVTGLGVRTQRGPGTIGWVPSPRKDLEAEPGVPPPMWTDKQTENITFPHTSYTGGKY